MRACFGYAGLWLALTLAYHAWVWPIFWRPAPRSPAILAFDAFQALLVVCYLRLHLRRRMRYRSSRAKWGPVIREQEIQAIERRVGAWLETERKTNCPHCGGTGRRSHSDGRQTSDRGCTACRGTGFRDGRIQRPFRVATGKRAIFIGYDALRGEPVYLEGERVYQTTHVYGIQGSGKTKRAAALVNKQLFAEANAAAVYFSMKAGDARAVAAMARENGWRTHEMKGVCLLNAFTSWSQLEEGLRKGMTAAGYRSRETFWFDRTLQLLRREYLETLKHARTARLGPTLARVMELLQREAAAGRNVKADQIAVSDVAGYLLEFNDPLSPVRWWFDASPDDLVPGESRDTPSTGRVPDWSPLAGNRQLMLLPPIGTSKGAVVAATALKYASLLWFEAHKSAWQEADPAGRHRIAYIQDEGDNFVVISKHQDIDDVYAAKTWRESGYSAWVYTQSQHSIAAAAGEKTAAYLAVVGNTITFALPDPEVARFIRELPEYEYRQRSLNLQRRSNHYQDHDNLLSGQITVSRGESLQMVKGPWITAEGFQRLPKGCAILQQAGHPPRVLWIPYFDHVAIEVLDERSGS